MSVKYRLSIVTTAGAAGSEAAAGATDTVALPV
jgi:hypothetical protein